MKIIIDKKILLDGLGRVQKPLNNSPQLESLKGIKIEAQDNKLTLTTCDGTLSSQTNITLEGDSKIEQNGKALVSGKEFINIIKKQSKQIFIEVEKNSMVIRSSGTKVVVNLFDFDSYPNVDFSLGEGTTSFTIDKDVWKEVIEQVSISSEENNQINVLGGINIKGSGDNVTFTATDRKRASIKTIKTKDIEKEFNTTILTKNLLLIAPVKNDNELTFIIDSNKISIQNDNTIMQSLVIDGQYPDVSSIVPTTVEANVKIDKKEMIDLIEKATVIENEQSVVELIISNGNKMSISLKSELGVTKSETEKLETQIDDLTISFNSKFMMKAIKTLGNDILFNFSTKEKPIILTSSETPTLKQIIMPNRNQ